MARRVGLWLLRNGSLLCVLSCGAPGVVEVHPVPNSARAASSTAAEARTDDAGSPDSALGACPDGWSCMDIAKLGYSAMDADGDPVGASCSMGASILPCKDDDPGASCPGLPDPLCVHLKLGGQEIVSCGQRCAP
jgi:hypothetical protein